MKKSEIGLFPAWQAEVKTFFKISGDTHLLVIALQFKFSFQLWI